MHLQAAVCDLSPDTRAYGLCIPCPNNSITRKYNLQSLIETQNEHAYLYPYGSAICIPSYVDLLASCMLYSSTAIRNGPYIPSIRWGFASGREKTGIFLKRPFLSSSSSLLILKSSPCLCKSGKSLYYPLPTSDHRVLT